MRMRWKTAASFNFLLLFVLLLKGATLIPNVQNKQHSCIGCVLVVSIIEQLAQVHNSTEKEALERLCSYLPAKLHLQGACILIAEIFGPHIIELIEHKMNPDVVCHSIGLCKRKAGQPFCHLYPPTKMGFNVAIKESERMVANQLKENIHRLSGVCSLPFLKQLCEKIQLLIRSKLPFEDLDGDKFSLYPTLRGYHWRGRDCDDVQASVYPGRRPHNWDADKDSNCNGIWGVDPKDGITYEQKFCKGTESKGIILLGDSAGAHFHIPPEWVTASQMSVKAFSNLPEAFANELDWPQFSGVTGFLNATIGGWTESLYLYLRKRNRCNHRDYQNISKNGGSSNNVLELVKSLARSQQFDKPAFVIFSMIGNDVCNGYPDTVEHMTRPEQMRTNVMQALQYLNGLLPKGSHVLLTGLADGRFLWDNLHDRFHPLGQLNKDVTYEHFYSFLSCLQSAPCVGWMSANATLRNLTSERALQLSSALKELAKSEKYANFDVFYMDYPLKEVAEMWQKSGGEAWQLIEPVDGFHPNQVASALGARIIWKKILREWPHVLGKENPSKDEIIAVFKDQGGH
ncbi:acyloxyacyl hydrolase [Zootoca vivipara]|uniref:acyloxyacyl hydrolase n=1 Tax=Zootoca vivipara TaxID=8524 RepID=UPI00293B8DB3|nr:acyloxyacyl hydrolase [Zootoca vivipara]